jgi:hypothetical protein
VRSPGILTCALAALLLVVSGCSDTDEDAEESQPRPEVTLAFAQWLPDEGTDRAMLRVTNDSAEHLEVTGAGLRWSGYDDFVDAQDSSLAPGQTLDLRVSLPDAHCDQGSEPIVGVVRTPSAEVAEELTENSQEFLRHLWQRACEADLVRSQVSISYGDDFRIAAVAGQPTVVGSLLLTRQAGDETVTALGASGSVLYYVKLGSRVTAASDQQVTRVPLRISGGNRCDEHARGQATAPFTFRVTLRVADTTTPMLIPPPPAVQALATEALDRTCRQLAEAG